MKKKHILISVAAIIIPAATLWATDKSPVPPGETVKVPISLKAGNILPAEVLQGDNYSIEDPVENDGFVNLYRLETNYGPMWAETTAQLMIRLSELKAMGAMEQMDQKKIFGDALISGVKAPFEGAANLVKSPVETTKSVVKGTGRFFSNIGRSIFSDDPHQVNVVGAALGYDTAKRAFAFQLGINPYTDNEAVGAMLGRIAQAAVAGGIAPKAAMSLVSYDVVTVMQLTSLSEGMLTLVRDNSPAELQKINASKLSKMGISPDLADAFLNNYAIDPQEQTVLVGELERLEGVGGRDKFIAVAATAWSKPSAVYYRVMAQMIAGYHERVSPLASIDRFGGALCLNKKDGTVILTIPVDYIFPTADMLERLERWNVVLQKDGNTPARELWLTGRVDAGARKILEASGWKITEDAGQQLLGK